jgi:hypothetical protein
VNYTCNYDLPDYKYLYFPRPHPDYLNHTTCVKKCPKTDTEIVSCAKNDVIS